MNGLKRPALGQKAALGALYDARRDAFLPNSLLLDRPPEGAISNILINRREMALSTAESFKDKFEKLNMNDELIASFMAGMVDVRGSGRYLTQKRGTLSTVHRALYFTITTRQERLNFGLPDLRDYLDFSVLEAGLATHVTIGVTWGARSIVAATSRLEGDTDRSKCESTLSKAFQLFEGIEDSDFEAPALYGWRPDTDDLQLVIHSDLIAHETGPVEDLQGALRHIQRLPKLVDASNDGKGQPLTYLLLPISAFITLGAPFLDDMKVGQLSSDCLEKVVNLFDELWNSQQSLSEYYKTLKRHRLYIRPDHIIDVGDRLQMAKDAELDLKSNYAHSLEAIRAGRANGQKTLRLLEDFLRGNAAPNKLAALTGEYVKKLGFIAMAMNKGAEYVGYSGPSLEDSLRRNQRGTTYVFYFNSEVIGEASWEENLRLLDELLNGKSLNAAVLVVDCDATGMSIPNAFVSVVQNGAVVKDLLAQRNHLADKCLMRFHSLHLDSKVTNSPSQRRLVKLPCPGRGCSRNTVCEWICSKCLVPVDFGHVDRFFYCDCGRTPFNQAEFNCQRSHHGPSFEKYSDRVLWDLLQHLPPPQELNVLILGETGVGKSTFINAFVNYLTFSSLDEGLSARTFNWIIPCSFTTQITDQQTGRLVPTDVKIGTDQYEHDSTKGQSATQKATVYPLYIGDTLVRLIDTPGIGDTRGIEQDGKNMLDVLSVLRNYPALHGILILLKPNNARLGVMFRFCVKELLTHLHRNAAENMVFGFTNTRGSNYTPGDTFRPLEELLSEYRDVIPGLFRSNVYCFDSESFRYLAARKQNVDIGNIEDYRRSWEQSTTEAERLLAHFRSLRPHRTQNTLSLNETRHLIAQLTVPMQEVSAAITDTVANNEKEVRDLASTRLTGQALRSRLTITKTVVSCKDLDRPKTVCSNQACTEAAVSPDHKNVFLRKYLCHNPCCLTDVPPNRIGTPQISDCAAFTGGICTTCSHGWQEHEHIVVEWSKATQTTTDPQVQQELCDNGNVIRAKEAQIQALNRQIAELKQEHRGIQEAAAKFSNYLKNNSITYYNDATLEYLEHLIRDENSKIRAGGSRARLEVLEKDKAQYEQFVAAMEKGKSSGSRYRRLDEKGVASLVQKLYNMPHYGAQLRDVAKVVGKAYEATYREKPYRIRRRNFWMTEASGKRDSKPILSIPYRSVSRTQNGPPLRSMFLWEDAPPPTPMSGELPVQSMLSVRENENKSKGSSSELLGARQQPTSSIPAVQSISDWVDEPPRHEDGKEHLEPDDQYLGSISGPNQYLMTDPSSAPPPYVEDPESSYHSLLAAQLAIRHKESPLKRLKFFGKRAVNKLRNH